MAINPTTEFVGKIASDPTNYPYGKAKNVTTPGDGTGTPWIASLLNDIFGFQQALLKAAGIIPSGTPDKFGASEYMQSVIALASGRAMRYDDTGAVNAVVLTARTNQQSVSNLFDGLTVQFIPVITNTGAVTLDYNATGVLNLKNVQGDDIDVGFLDPTLIYTSVYHSTPGEWRLSTLMDVWSDVIRSGFGGSVNTTPMVRIGSQGFNPYSVGGVATLQLGGNGILSSDDSVGSSNHVNLSQNLTGGSIWYHLSTGAGSVYRQDSGRHIWFTSPSKSAGSSATATEIMRTDTNGNLLMGKTSINAAVAGVELGGDGRSIFSRNVATPIYVNRITSDGNLIELAQDNTIEGSISVSGTIVSYNSFCGGHWSQLTTNTTDETFTKGMVVETIDEMCEWADEDNDQLVRFKKSDTVGSKRVYGIFSNWDMDDDYDDAIIHAIGATQILITGSCEGGDLLESNGDGTARVQADDLIRSSTIGKVTMGDSDVSVTLVPCVLYCG
ncbi:MAG: hypothetical protein JRJ62_00140 [Deltaproteobacteria bacterium]|nr:hypothetical protein [Deltaproteobacteria bacterium]